MANIKPCHGLDPSSNLGRGGWNFYSIFQNNKPNKSNIYHSKMSWLSRIFGKKKTEEKVIENISFEQVFGKIEEKCKEIVEKDYQIKKSISDSINNFENQLKESIKILEKIDLAERKEYQHIKRITLDNLRLYIDHLRNLIFNLKKIENLESQSYLNRIVVLLNDFNKTSEPYFERATILIGKELGTVKDLIRDFGNSIINISNENSSFFKQRDLNKQVKTLIDEWKANNSSLEALEDNINKLKENLNLSQKNSLGIKQKTQEVIESLEHKKDIEEKENYDKNLNELEKEIREIKQRIDFKLLAKYFHYDLKISKIIKDYSENFKIAIENDKALEIQEIIKKAQSLEMDLKDIQTKVIEFNKPFIAKTGQEIELLKENLKKSDSKNNNLDIEIKEEYKKQEKLIEKGNELKSKIEKIAKELFPNSEIKL